MAEQKRTSFIDYSKWDDIALDNDMHIDVEEPHNFQIPSINTTNITREEAERIKIPRSPRPLPAEPPILANDDLLEPPPPNAPKGAAAVRHYQIGFGRNIIKNRPKHKSKAASMSILEQMQKFVLDEQNPLRNEANDDVTSNETHSKRKYGIQIEEDNETLLRECGELLQFMMNETKKDISNAAKKPHQQPNTNDIFDENESFHPSHHDYYRHNPHDFTHKKHDSQNQEMYPKIDVIVKMGGSFLTNKQTLHSLKETNIDIAVQHISDAFKAKYQMILVHGAGSFGHFEAKEYKLVNGLYTESAPKGMALCRNAVTMLHQKIISKLLEYELPVISVSPNGIITSSNGSISRKQFRLFTMHILKILKSKMIPLIHGDVIFDTKRGCHVLSGDVILEHLASVFDTQRAVFWSDIDGVYDLTDGTYESEEKCEPKLIEYIHVSPQGMPLLNDNIVKQLKNPQKYKTDKNDKVSIDVTGGMWNKIEVAARCCAQGTDVVITKGGTEDAKLALLGRHAENATVFVRNDSEL